MRRPIDDYIELPSANNGYSSSNLLHSFFNNPLSKASAAKMIPRQVIILLYVLDLAIYSFKSLLYLLGFNPSFRSEPAPWDSPELLFFAADLAPLELTPDTLKSMLPVLEYRDLAEKRGKSLAEAAPECAVCLQLLQARDSVRDLGKCCHSFHVECMDGWLNLGRFSCPLCRSSVIPDGVGLAGGEAGPLSVLKVLLGVS